MLREQRIPKEIAYFSDLKKCIYLRVSSFSAPYCAWQLWNNDVWRGTATVPRPQFPLPFSLCSLFFLLDCFLRRPVFHGWLDWFHRTAGIQYLAGVILRVHLFENLTDNSLLIDQERDT